MPKTKEKQISAYQLAAKCWEKSFSKSDLAPEERLCVGVVAQAFRDLDCGNEKASARHFLQDGCASYLGVLDRSQRSVDAILEAADKNAVHGKLTREEWIDTIEADWRKRLDDFAFNCAFGGPIRT